MTHRPGGCGLGSRVLVALAAAALAVAGRADEDLDAVLVLYSQTRVLPANVECDRGLREALGAAGRPVRVLEEFLDVVHPDAGEFERTLLAFLREKYAGREPRVIVAAGGEALSFLLAHRSELCPGARVVHAAVFASELDRDAARRAEAIGSAFDDDVAPTIEQALRWHPDAARVVVVTGTARTDRLFEARLRDAEPRFAGRARFEFLAGLPSSEVRARVAALGADAVVFTPGYFRDGAGQESFPREAVRAIAAASGAPVYGPASTFVGTGIVGGWMPDYVAIGRDAGALALSLLGGADPATAGASLPPTAPVRLHVDWRAAERWHIPPSAIPREAVVHFRTPTFLEEHRELAVAFAVAFLLQTGLVAGLLVERHRRRTAERAVQRHQAELAHASRVAIAGELTGSIAHQINQPLGAILANAEAAEMLLESGSADRRQLRSILDDIRRDDLRASEVIRRLRSLLARHEVSRGPLALAEVLADVEAVLRAEAKRRGVALEVGPAPDGAVVLGDRLQAQQVLLNLALNAMDFASGLPDERRTVELLSEVRGDDVVVAVRDRGPGIAPEHLPRIFDSFFSTKPGGMGLGLSIARTLVEGMGGSIEVESRPGEGATFRVRLPLDRLERRPARGAR